MSEYNLRWNIEKFANDFSFLLLDTYINIERSKTKIMEIKDKLLYLSFIYGVIIYSLINDIDCSKVESTNIFQNTETNNEFCELFYLIKDGKDKNYIRVILDELTYDIELFFCDTKFDYLSFDFKCLENKVKDLLC